MIFKDTIMSNIGDFEIIDGILKKYRGDGINIEFKK